MTRRRRRQVVRLGLAASVTTAVVLGAGGGTAWAHAGLASSTHGEATGLAQAPGAVVLRFTEPLNRRLSSLEVTGPDGRER